MTNALRKFARLAAAAALSLALPACAGEPVAETRALATPPAAATATPGAARPALWLVSDADTRIYLFGTIHALPPGVEWFGGTLAQAFEESDELVTEIIEEEPATMQALVLDRATLPQGTSLRSLLAADDRAALEKSLGSIGLPPASFDGFEPWYAAIALSTMPMMRSGYARELGVEHVLDARARELGHGRSAVETAAYQLSLFDSFPLPVQKRYLAEVVANLPTMTDDLGRMVDAWKQGDATTLAKIMNAAEDDPQLLETLLVNRNRAWAGWIARRLDRPGTVFFAVGAGHLAGTGSVQDQLVELGLKAQRIQ